MGMSFDLLSLIVVSLITLIIGLIMGFFYPLIAIPDILAFLFNKKKELLEINYGTGDRYYVTPHKDSFGNMLFKIAGVAQYVDTDQFDTAPITHWGPYRIRQYWAGSSLPTNSTNSAAITQVLEIVKNTKTGNIFTYDNLRRLAEYQIMNLATCDIKLLKELIEKYVPKVKINSDSGKVEELDDTQYATEKALKTYEIGREVARLRMFIRDQYLTPRFLLLPYAENATQQKIAPTVLRDVDTNAKLGIFNKEEWMRTLMNYAIIFLMIGGGTTLFAILIYIFIWHK